MTSHASYLSSDEEWTRGGLQKPTSAVKSKKKDGTLTAVMFAGAVLPLGMICLLFEFGVLGAKGFRVSLCQHPL